MQEKTQLIHPKGKKAVSMDKVKYTLLKNALLSYLKKFGESTHTEIWKAVAKDFIERDVKFEGSIQWNMEWVKLDLEANNIIKRIPGTAPIKYKII